MNIAKFLGIKPAWLLVGCSVTARRVIHDSPLANPDCSAIALQVGECVDYDELNDLLYVDFGKGAIACSPEEVCVTATITR